MIGSSKNNRGNYLTKYFWTHTKKETRVKFNPRLSANRSSNNWIPGFLVVRETPRSTHVVYSWFLLLLTLMTMFINFIVNIILINLICNLQRFLYRKTPKDTCNDYARCGVCCVFPRTWLHSITWPQRQRGCQGIIAIHPDFILSGWAYKTTVFIP